ncbi:MAG: nicotinamide-nucleotide amidohydrolase family protein, partial [Acidimicrobiia bacterium]
SAPGLALEHEGVWLFVLPGVPEEMVLLLADHVMPRLRKAAGIDEVLVSRVLRTWGRSESQVAEILDDLYGASSNPSVAFLASAGEIKVRLTAKASTIGEAEALITPVDEQVRARLGATVFAVDGDTIESVLFGLLRARQWTIGTAESVTGGGVAARLTSVPGASAVYRGSVVPYATDLKMSLLGLENLEGQVVSEAAALAMSAGARGLLGVDVAIGLTGSAGPDPQERPPGTVVVAVATPEDAAARTLTLPGDRERVRAYAGTAALQLARLAVSGEWWAKG